MASMRSAAEDTYGKKLDRMGLRVMTASTGAKGVGDAYPQDDGTQGMAQGSRAKGYETEEDNERTLEEKAPKKLRLDRKQSFAKGGRVAKKGGTTVNVIVAPSKPQQPPMMPPMVPPGPPDGGPPPMPPPPGGPGDAMGGPPMMRAKGGRVPVPMDAGAGGGLGREEKIKAYGKRAYPNSRAGTM